MKYIPLNIKTEYDLMNSLIKIDELISYAKENGIDAIGITDSNMFGAYEFINKCNQNDIKSVIGCEININEDSQYLLASIDYRKCFWIYNNRCPNEKDGMEKLQIK